MSTVIRQPINDDYEYIQYNNQLRIVHSIDDDMYQMKSIITACKSNKLCADWFRNRETKELLKTFEHDKDLMGTLPVDNRINVPNELKGYYVHRLLVNAVAMWASPRYALNIFKMLDQMATSERAQMESVIQQQRPRMVPQHHEHDYKYLIWREPHRTYPKSTILHLVRRSNSTFKEVIQHYNNESERWFFRENLPISMSVNKDIKEIIKQVIPAGEYEMNSCDVTVPIKYLDQLHEAISEYFNQFQK